MLVDSAAWETEEVAPTAVLVAETDVAVATDADDDCPNPPCPDPPNP